MKEIFFNLRFLQKSSHHQIYHHIKYKVIATNQLWQINFFQPIWNDFYDRLNLRWRVNSAKYIAR